MKDVVIVSACRTAIGAFGGTLCDLNITDLAQTVMKAAIERAGIAPELIDEVRMGCNLESHGVRSMSTTDTGHGGRD